MADLSPPTRPQGGRTPVAAARPTSSRPSGGARPQGRRSGGAWTALPPPPPPPAAPAGRPTDRTSSRPATGRRRSGSSSGPAGCLLPLALLVAALLGVGWFAAQDDDDDGSRSAAPSGVSGPAPTSGAVVTALPPISLPGPFGSAPRVRPLQTTVIVTQEVLADSGAALSIATELPVAVDYMQRHGMVGDGLSLGHRAPQRLSLHAASLRASATGPPAGTGTPLAQSTAAAARMAPFSEDDRQIVVITSDPARWLPVMPSAPSSDLRLPPAERPAALRGVVLTVRSSSGIKPALPPSPLPSPQSIDFDPLQRGHLAEAVARAWVAGFDGGWPT